VASSRALGGKQEVAPPTGAQQVSGLEVYEVPVFIRDGLHADLTALSGQNDGTRLLLAYPLQDCQRIVHAITSEGQLS
jgi:hypothetical protein